MITCIHALSEAQSDYRRIGGRERADALAAAAGDVLEQWAWETSDE